jgi:hypothetical protein
MFLLILSCSSLDLHETSIPTFVGESSPTMPIDTNIEEKRSTALSLEPLPNMDT